MKKIQNNINEFKIKNDKQLQNFINKATEDIYNLMKK